MSGEDSPETERSAELEDDLAAERRALAAEREGIERLRSELLSKVSHELRTPLTLIRTSIGLLLDADPDPAMRERLLRNIKGSADRMHALVTDMLDLVRLGSGRVEYQFRYLDVGALVEEAARLMRPLVDQKHQALELELPKTPLRVLGDRRRLEQVLLNLLSNANKFSPDGARIRVTAAASDAPESTMPGGVTADAEVKARLKDDAASGAHGGEKAGQDWGVVVRVADTGPGIAPEALPRLFEQFFTERTSSASHNIGAGLGLPISRAIARAHGGEILVESKLGQGTTFLVYLPGEGPDDEAPNGDAAEGEGRDGEPTRDERDTEARG